MVTVAAFFAPDKDSDLLVQRNLVKPTKNYHKSTSIISSQSSSEEYTLPDRSHLGENISELFFTYTEPQIEKRTIKQKPVAPQLPYRYMGKMLEKGQWTIFLTRNDKPYVVHEGELLDYEYSVNSIKPPVLELIYLPLNEKQTLLIGDN